MRVIVGLFGLLFGAVVIAITARYGFKSSDSDADGFIWAFFYGAIAVGGLFGHAVALRVWRHDRFAGAFIFLVAAAALTINLSNSLGAMAGRGNEAQAKRLKLADDIRGLRRSLKQAEDEREVLQFTPTDEATVAAARKASLDATESRKGECDKRGPNCRAREETERNANQSLGRVTAHRAATDRAAKLDGDITTLSKRLSEAGPLLEANPQGSAFARLLDLPESKAVFLSTWQNFAMTVTVELLIVGAMIAFEVLGKAARGTQEVRTTPASVSPVRTALVPSLVVPKPEKPRLIATIEMPFGSVASIMADLIEPGRGRVEFAEAYLAYAAVCRAQAKRPVPPESFGTALKKLCQASGIQFKTGGEFVYLLKVRIKLPAVEANSA